MNKLNIYDRVVFDESVTKEEFHTYHPTMATFKNNNEIRIIINNQDIYTATYESYLNISGSVNIPATSTNQNFSFVSNGICFLFTMIRYELNGVEIDKNRDVGITSTMKGLISHTVSDINPLDISGWMGSAQKNFPTYNDVNKKFFVQIPLKYLLGVAEDYRKVISHVKQELILIRSRTDSDAYVGSSDATITLDKVDWHVPHIQLSDEEKLRITEGLSSQKPRFIPFRRWELHEMPSLKLSKRDVWIVKTSSNLEKPRYVILGFQTNRRDRLDADPSSFDNASIINIKLFLNAESYPYDSLNLDISSGDYLTVQYVLSISTELLWKEKGKSAVNVQTICQ